MNLFKNMMKIGVVTACVTTISATGCFALNPNGHGYGLLKKAREMGYKNVIVMIPDGCDEAVQTAARWYKGEDLQVDKMQNAAVKIHMANSVITGSAAAATAFATSHKTTVRFLGIGPRTDDLLTGFEPTAEPYAPVASILEAAKMKGMATGIAATSRVTHATPAAFACHIDDRGETNKIMEHIVYENIDVVFGGGARHLIPEDETYTTSFGDSWGGKRTDGENLMDVLTERGYQFVDSKEGLETLTSGKVWGLFDDSHMQPDIDRQYFAEHEPALSEMVDKAIELLSQDRDGFFLMVEGSQVDWAGHNNDPIYMITDFIAFDDAVKVACDFAEKDGQTLVLAYPDHNTGGMKIGHYYTDVAYTETTIEDLVDPLKGMKMSANGVVAMMAEDTDAELITSVSENWGLTITQDDVDEIRAYQDDMGQSLSYSMAAVLSKNYTVIGWTTHGHNGETVPVWVYGDDAPVGTIDNTDLALIAADAMGADLDQVTQDLYVEVSTVFDDYELDETDAENPVLIVKGAEMPISKDYMVYNGKTIQMPGLTVYAPMTGKVYISKQAVNMLRRL
ncbi:alkaline phosphatase [Desulfosarcina ovata]|uniref:Alkaline phosphatase n=2 Tax=Desulfosarcina ovata TaxID=83564 RepID=A0A5K8AK01_9BACT|nr:alkaline phosphatase [Desulfosarcina ovata]BBO86109.1 alkaline phosphatase [Desulfosarcina ovata subsp. sediminis]BBO93043.1 alkaline phosphatase [Desulfosarcina ovata subsp. ovata]